jgi:hypothetical protein
MRSYLLGRLRMWPMGEPSPTDIANNPNQFTGADIIDLGLMRLWPLLIGKYRQTVITLAHQHDAIYWEVPDDDRFVLQFGKDVKDAFTQVHKTPAGVEIEFPIDLKHGYAMHDEIPGHAWNVGRPGMTKLKL